MITIKSCFGNVYQPSYIKLYFVLLSGGTAVTLIGTNMNSSAVPLITVTTVLETFNNISDSEGTLNIMSNSQVC